MIEFTAHIRENDKAKQSVKEHSENTAALTSKFLKSTGLASVGKLTGLVHDFGKLRVIFDDYINGRNNISRGSIDHSFAGARYLFELSGDNEKKKTAAISMAHTIVSHHGIHDWIDENYDDYFYKRITNGEDYDEILSNIGDVLDGKDINKLFDSAVNEWFIAANKINTKNKTEFTFCLGMLERLIQSALIDADRTDTADFMSGRKTVITRDANLWENMDARMDKKLESFSGKTDTISLQRRSISDRCAAFSAHRVGACRLIVPTGGGKTLSSLRFAVKQCKEFGLERIFYIAPFMSILEQNSDVIKELAGEENFLEHHSNLAAEIEDENEYNEYELRAERWDTPVIATTMVQFLNTLFSARASSVRRMHCLCNSVIIIDEVQSVPLKCTRLFSLAMNFLTKICGSTVVLCSATQPTFDRLGLALDHEQDMIADYQKDFEVFKRTELIPELKKYGYDFDAAAEFCEQRFEENGSLLLIVNTKKQAIEMYSRLKARAEGKADIIHLSTNMCPAHRKECIEILKKMLDNSPVICVTTQLIEAGVDISFGCVVRALAGLDNAAQAAGRCNRNGEKGRICPVYLINFKEEKLGSLTDIKNAKDISANIIKNNSDDLISADVQSCYFDWLFKKSSDMLDYPVGKNETLLNLLSLNKNNWEIRKKTDRCLSQAFKTAGQLFKVIDSNTENVLVPYNDEAEKMISELESELTPWESASLLRRAQKYTVSVYMGTKQALISEGAVELNKNGVLVLDKRFYSSEFGVTTEGADQEILIF